MSWVKKFVVPVPLGLVETQAAGYRARFGHWPRGYMDWSMKHCRGIIPQRVTDLVAKLERERPWERCKTHGTDLVNGSGYCRPCMREWLK